MNSGPRVPVHAAWLASLFLVSFSLGPTDNRSFAQAPTGWAESVKLPVRETPIRLFNGKDLTGWEGQTDKYWAVEDGAIKAANGKASLAASTYLYTKQKFRDFRLLLEVKQTLGPEFSTMHSALALLGQRIEDKGIPFSYRGHLVLFCNDWGVYEVNGRKRLAPANHKGVFAHLAEKAGDWNQLEILVIGNRLRSVANGQLVADYTEPEADKLQPAPLGLQLHSNSRPQEYRFRGLILTENPEDVLATLNDKK
jgi:hypothetical protein